MAKRRSIDYSGIDIAQSLNKANKLIASRSLRLGKLIDIDHARVTGESIPHSSSGRFDEAAALTSQSLLAQRAAAEHLAKMASPVGELFHEAQAVTAAKELGAALGLDFKGVSAAQLQHLAASSSFMSQINNIIGIYDSSVLNDYYHHGIIPDDIDTDSSSFMSSSKEILQESIETVKKLDMEYDDTQFLSDDAIKFMNNLKRYKTAKGAANAAAKAAKAVGFEDIGRVVSTILRFI